MKGIMDSMLSTHPDPLGRGGEQGRNMSSRPGGYKRSLAANAESFFSRVLIATMLA